MKRSVIFLLVIICCTSGVRAALGPDSLSELKRFSDFQQIDVKRLLEGEILSQRGPLMKFPNGISSQLCFAVPASPAETVKRLQSWDAKSCPSLKVYASHDLNDPCDRNEFNSLYLYLDPGLRPVKWLLDQTRNTSERASELNLTQIEAATLARCAGKNADPKSAGSCWGDLLFARAQGFQRNGFAGALPYDFDITPVNPIAHVRSMLQEQVEISREFATLLQRAGAVGGAAGTTPLRPSYYWRMSQADHHATLSLGAAYDLQVGDRYQRLEIEYYVSGTYYTSATLYEIWPIRDGGRTGSIVWSDVLCSAPTLRFATGIERLASGVIMLLEFKKMVHCFQDSFKTR